MMHAQTQGKIPAPTGAAPLRGMTLQRKCACGESASLSGACEDCDREKLLQRRAAGNSPAAVPSIVHEVLRSPEQPLVAGTSAFMEPRFGHDFSRVRVQSPGAVRFQGDGPVEGKTDPKKAPEKEKVEKPAVKSLTPDGLDLGPTDKAKTFCLTPNSFAVTTSVNANTDSAAQGAQRIKFEGQKTGVKDKKACSCDCGVYRHWISGFIQVIGPTAKGKARAELAFESQKKGTKTPATAQEVLSRAIATTPKTYDFQSCQHPLKMQENALTEEYTACIGDNDPDACKWKYGDGPGATGGLSEGLYVRMKQTFKYEIWDACQGTSVTTKQATISIEGDKKPRSILWS